MIKTPKGNRLHISFFGRRNVGKSSLMNALTRQNTSLVSEIPGTTTDPVEKTMEILPIGPVLLLDTAGLDDVGKIGALRIEKTKTIFDRTDIAVIITTAPEWGDFEKELISTFEKRGTPYIVVINKIDLAMPDEQMLKELQDKNIPYVLANASQKIGVLELREALIKAAPEEFIQDPTILGDIIDPGDTIILVVPIDYEAPKGRLILPEVQTLRDILDNDALSMVVKEHQLRQALDLLKTPPALVITDSQAFDFVSKVVPETVPLTSFSILFSRLKGDFNTFLEGTKHISELKPGDHVLIAEACTHHPIKDDIGTEKIPRWLTEHVGGPLNISHVQGHNYPEDVSGYNLIVHCGSCMFNRRELLSRIEKCKNKKVPITNYGMTIAFVTGIFNRAIAPIVKKQTNV